MSAEVAPVAILINGVPRSGKSALAVEIIAAAAGDWVQLGVDSLMASTPDELLPGIGLRPGGERPDLEPLVLTSYQQLFADIAGHLDNGINVVADVGIHDWYSQPLNIMGEMQSRLANHHVLFVGLHCSVEVLCDRRKATGYLSWEPGEPVPDPVLRWQQAVHEGKTYDLELDSSTMTPPVCAAEVLQLLS